MVICRLTLEPAHAAPLPSPHHVRRRAVRRAALPRSEIAGPRRAPLVVVLGGISTTAHVTATADDPKPGWWSNVDGDGKGIDTRRYRVLSVDYLDGGRAQNGVPQRP